MVPHRNHQHNRGHHRTSSGQQCSGRWCRQTRSLSTFEALRTDNSELRDVAEDLKKNKNKVEGKSRKRCKESITGEKTGGATAES